jgi:hypothetical protein
MKPDRSPEERLARAILVGSDAESLGELVWADSTWRSMPTDEQLVERAVRGLLDRESLRDDERVTKWLLAFAWSRIERDRLRVAVVRAVRERFLSGIRRYVKKELDDEGLAKPTAKRVASRATDLDRQIVLDQLGSLERETPGGLHSFRRLRPVTGLEPEAFDRAVLALATDRRIVIHHHDYPAGLTSEERGWYVRDGSTWYVGAGFPRK